MTSRVILLALSACLSFSFRAQTLATPDLLALSELEVLVSLCPEPKALVDFARHALMIVLKD